MAIYDITQLPEEDQDLIKKMSYQSWYFSSDLSALWGVDAKEARKYVGRLINAGALRVQKRTRDHNRQGAPSTVFCRADSFDDAHANIDVIGRAVRLADDTPASVEEED